MNKFLLAAALFLPAAASANDRAAAAALRLAEADPIAAEGLRGVRSLFPRLREDVLTRQAPALFGQVHETLNALAAQGVEFGRELSTFQSMDHTCEAGQGFNTYNKVWYAQRAAQTALSGANNDSRPLFQELDRRLGRLHLLCLSLGAREHYVARLLEGDSVHHAAADDAFDFSAVPNWVEQHDAASGRIYIYYFAARAMLSAANRDYYTANDALRTILREGHGVGLVVSKAVGKIRVCEAAFIKTAANCPELTVSDFGL